MELVGRWSSPAAARLTILMGEGAAKRLPVTKALGSLSEAQWGPRLARECKHTPPPGESCYSARRPQAGEAAGVPHSLSAVCVDQQQGRLEPALPKSDWPRAGVSPSCPLQALQEQKLKV